MRLILAKSLFFVFLVLALTSTGVQAQVQDYSPRFQTVIPTAQPAAAASPAAVAAGTYVLVGWSELGMHCMDGKDYSVFSVLPPTTRFMPNC